MFPPVVAKIVIAGRAFLAPKANVAAREEAEMFAWIAAFVTAVAAGVTNGLAIDDGGHLSGLLSCWLIAWKQKASTMGRSTFSSSSLTAAIAGKVGVRVDFARLSSAGRFSS